MTPPPPLPVKAGPPPKPPAEALPGLFDLWLAQRALEDRILELETHKAAPVPRLSVLLAPLVFGALFLVGCLAALAGLVVAVVMG